MYGFYMCVSIFVMYKLMSGRNTNERATFWAETTGQGQGRYVIISRSNGLCVWGWGLGLILSKLSKN